MLASAAPGVRMKRQMSAPGTAPVMGALQNSQNCMRAGPRAAHLGVFRNGQPERGKFRVRRAREPLSRGADGHRLCDVQQEGAPGRAVFEMRSDHERSTMR